VERNSSWGIENSCSTCAEIVRADLGRKYFGDERQEKFLSYLTRLQMSLRKDGRKMRTMKTYCVMILAVALMFVGNAYSSSTVATFADPALNASTPLFNVNSATKTVTGGWSDTQTGLNLQVVWTGNTFNNAYFTMTPLTMSTGALTYDTTGAGTIKFFKDGDPTSATPLLQIDFTSSSITFGGISGNNLFSSNGVKFSGSEIGSTILSDEVFAFSFANLQMLNFASATNGFTAPINGYTATASFTSSAIPEPATLALLGIGGAALLRRRSC
jgi:hypothetical protein